MDKCVLSRSRFKSHARPDTQEVLTVTSYERDGRYVSILVSDKYTSTSIDGGASIMLATHPNATLQDSLEELEMLCSTNESLLSSSSSCPLTAEEVAKMRVFYDGKILVQKIIKDLPRGIVKSKSGESSNIQQRGAAHA